MYLWTEWYIIVRYLTLAHVAFDMPMYVPLCGNQVTTTACRALEQASVEFRKNVLETRKGQALPLPSAPHPVVNGESCSTLPIRPDPHLLMKYTCRQIQWRPCITGGHSNEDPSYTQKPTYSSNFTKLVLIILCSPVVVYHDDVTGVVQGS